MRLTRDFTFVALAGGLAQLALAGSCPSCDPETPEYFTHTEAIAECVHVRETAVRSGSVEEWEITLPNDHIWSGDDDGDRLHAYIEYLGNKTCTPVLNFTAMPIDEWGTVDVSFVTPTSCAGGDIEAALYETMARRLKMECVKINAGGSV